MPPHADDQVLILIDDDVESMDVSLTKQVLEEFGMRVRTASRSHRQCTLTDNYMTPQLTIAEALKMDWKLIILPGVSNLQCIEGWMQLTSFPALLESHVKKKRRIVAAMGASATHALTYLNYVDKMGPTCYPVPESNVVVKEYSEKVWTSPGQGTSTELALALGEHYYGKREANAVAERVKYVQGPWDMNKLRDLDSHRSEKPNRKRPMQLLTFNELAKRANGTTDWDHERLLREAYFVKLWPKLMALGWQAYANETRLIFAIKGVPEETWARHRQGVEWFSNYKDVMQFLTDNLHDALFEPLVEELYEHMGFVYKHVKRIGAPADEDVPASKEEVEFELFNHVVWRRLAQFGWQRVPDTDKICTPSDHRPPADFESRDELVDYLLADNHWSQRNEILAALDLYRGCQQTVQKQHSYMSPAEIEEETKRRMPALATF